MKYIVADDHPSARLMTCELIKAQLEVSLADIRQSKTIAELLEALADPDFAHAVIVVDLIMPGRYKRLQLVKEIRKRAPYARVVVHTSYESPHLAQELIFQGVLGYVFKTSPVTWLSWAIQHAARGERYIDPSLDTRRTLKIGWWELTTRESDVVVALCRGWSASAICERFNMKGKTLSAHKRSAMEKLKVSEEAGLSAYLFGNALDYLLDE